MARCKVGLFPPVCTDRAATVSWLHTRVQCSVAVYLIYFCVSINIGDGQEME